MSFVSLGRFTQRDEAGIGPCWCPPAGVTALIDLVPPGRDADPDVNFALMLSDTPLDSSAELYSLGAGNVTELHLDGAGQNAWQSITGFRPTQGTIAGALAQHLLNPDGANGLDFARPLTAGFNRGLEIQLGGEVWSHTLTGLSDPLSLPVLRVEVEGLAETYLTQGETAYRKSMYALRRKYDTRPIKELIQILFPSGRDDLPLMDELTADTVKTETFPTTGAITSGQDNTWSVVSGGITVDSAGNIQATSVAVESTGLLGYTFGGNDMISQFSLGVGDSFSFNGTLIRANAALSTAYLLPYRRANSMALYKSVSNSFTQIGSDFAASEMTLADVLLGSVVGSSCVSKRNGTTKNTTTDTSITSGTRVGLYLYRSQPSTQALSQPFSFDDTLSAPPATRRPVSRNSICLCLES